MHEISRITCHLITRGGAFFEILPTFLLSVQKGDRGPRKIVEKGEGLEIFLRVKRRKHKMRINLKTGGGGRSNAQKLYLNRALEAAKQVPAV